MFWIRLEAFRIINDQLLSRVIVSIGIYALIHKNIHAINVFFYIIVVVYECRCMHNWADLESNHIRALNGLPFDGQSSSERLLIDERQQVGTVLTQATKMLVTQVTLCVSTRIYMNVCVCIQLQTC